MREFDVSFIHKILVSSHMMILGLSHNSLESIPPNFSKMENLREFDVSFIHKIFVEFFLWLLTYFIFCSIYRNKFLKKSKSKIK